MCIEMKTLHAHAHVGYNPHRRRAYLPADDKPIYNNNPRHASDDPTRDTHSAIAYPLVQKPTAPTPNSSTRESFAWHIIILCYMHVSFVHISTVSALPEMRPLNI